jgi:hypothetical protein
MRRFVGLVPVLLLASAVVISAVIGLNLSHGGSGRDVADELGCEPMSSTHPQPGVSKTTCSYHGGTIVVLSLSKGTHALYPPDLPDNFIVGPAGNDWVIGCSHRDDCVKIQRELGGDLSSGPTLGLSLVIG